MKLIHVMNDNRAQNLIGMIVCQHDICAVLERKPVRKTLQRFFLPMTTTLPVVVSRKNF